MFEALVGFAAGYGFCWVSHRYGWPYIMAKLKAWSGAE
jgi:hypothetical protein